MNDGLNVDPDGTKWWVIDNHLHREDGPAVEHSSGNKSWYINGKLHREDGPAIENTSGVIRWYYHGKLLPVKTQEEFLIYIKLKVFW
jgi:hypothetical protein